MTITQELKTACAKGREYVLSPGVVGNFGISGGWAVRVEAEYNMPRGGPMKAWKYLYFLVPPNAPKCGGYDRADSFCNWAAGYIGKGIV